VNPLTGVSQKRPSLGGAEERRCVRRLAGYGRLSGLNAAAALERHYQSARLYVNLFQPSFKLAGKQRDGAPVRRRYHAPLPSVGSLRRWLRRA
jgi:hypothetical protein